MSARLASSLALLLAAGCASAPPPKPVEKPAISTQARERAACEDGDDLPHAVSADDAPLRRREGSSKRLVSPYFLADPIPSYEPPAMPDAAPRSRVDGLGPLTRIDLRGYLHVPPEKIREALSLAVGDRPTTAALRRDVRALYATGLFDDVQVSFDAGADHLSLIFSVRERPARGEIYFRGAESLTPDALRGVAALGDHPGNGAVAEAVRRIHGRYAEEGRFFAEVSAKVRPRKGEIDICFRITEGAQTRIERWDFRGNQAVSDAELAAVTTTEGGRYNVEGGLYSESRARDDHDREMALYYDHGFLTAEILPPEATFSEDHTRVTVVIPVREGPSFRISALRVEGDLAADRTKYAELLRSKVGEIFNRSRLLGDLERIRAFHKEAGQPLLEVTPDSEVDVAHGTVDVTMRVSRPRVDR